MKSKLFILFVFVFNIASAQNIFQKAIGIGNSEYAQSFCIYFDTIVTTCSGGLVKSDSCGNVIWAKRYLASGMYKKSKVLSLSNGGYIMLVDMIADRSGTGDIMVFNMKSEGLINWIKYFGTDGYDVPEDIAELPNGDLVITGQTNSFGHADKDVLLMCLSNYGDQLWQKSYGTSSDNDIAHKLVISAFGGFVMAGEMFSMNNILRTDENGNVKWCFSYGSGSLCDIAENPANGDLYVCGNITDDLRGGSNIFVMRTDSSGNVIWAKMIGHDHNEIAYTISCDKAYTKAYIAGEYQTDTAMATDAFAACLDVFNGSIQWAKKYGSPQSDVFYDNAIFNESSLINVGYSESDTAYQNIYMVKTTLDGVSGCNEFDLIPVVDSNLNIMPAVALISIDTGELMVTSVCYPPQLISHQVLTLCSTESIDATEKSVWRIYPNPAENFFSIDYELKTGETIDIFNETGQKVDFDYTNYGKTISVDAEKLSRGLYLIKISGGSQKIAQKIMIY